MMQNAALMGDYLKEGLHYIGDKSRIIGDVRGKGLLLAVEIVADKKDKSILPKECNAVYRLLEIGIENGLLLYTRKTAEGIFGEWVMVTPPLIITKEQVDELLELFEKNDISTGKRNRQFFIN